MRQNILLFLENITFNEKYQKCVREVKNNIERIKLANLFKKIRNSRKKKLKLNLKPKYLRGLM